MLLKRALLNIVSTYKIQHVPVQHLYCSSCVLFKVPLLLFLPKQLAPSKGLDHDSHSGISSVQHVWNRRKLWEFTVLWIALFKTQMISGIDLKSSWCFGWVWCRAESLLWLSLEESVHIPWLHGEVGHHLGRQVAGVIHSFAQLVYKVLLLIFLCQCGLGSNTEDNSSSTSMWWSLNGSTDSARDKVEAGTLRQL